ncbi:MAG: two-component regulator propeller domain-containing protein [Bacteroidales bacterium]
MPAEIPALHLHLLSPEKGLVILLFVSLLIAAGTDLFSQNYNIQAFTTREGISHNDVRAMAVDSSGFMWIATWDGLSRYDGYSFKNYFHKTNDSLSLPYFSVLNLQVDGADNLWLLTDDRKVAWYDRYNDNFRRVDHIPDNLPVSYQNISVDESGYLWLITEDSLIRYDFVNDAFDFFDITRYHSEVMVSNSNTAPTVSNPEQDRIWLVSDVVCEFKKYDGNMLELVNKYRIDAGNYPVFPDFNFTFNHRIWFSPSGRKWIFSNNGLFLLDENSGVFRKQRDLFPVDDFTGPGFFAWSEKNEGIFVLNRSENILYKIPPAQSQLVKRVFCQNKSVFWFSNNSFSGAPLGLNRVVFTPGWFKSYDIPLDINDIATVYAVTKDKYDRIWVGARGKYPLVRISPDGIVEKIRIDGIASSGTLPGISGFQQTPAYRG